MPQKKATSTARTEPAQNKERNAIWRKKRNNPAEGQISGANQMLDMWKIE